MFGHQDHEENDNTTVGPAPLADEPKADATLDMPAPVTPPHDLPMVTSSAPSVDDSVSTEDKAGDFIMTDPPQPHHASSDAGSPAPASPHADDLLDIKQEALQQLSPLIGHLDQSPEEKFRTTMMMIQAADNQALIKDAYAAAQQINDEKERAQALLDIVNEINYFTQHNEA